MVSEPQQVTQLLNQFGNGDQAALEQLMPLVYSELHKLAKRHMAHQKPGHTLQTTAVVHEAYLKLVGESSKRWENRAHFYGVAAKAMRHILVDHARSSKTAKRGAGHAAVSLDEALAATPEKPPQVIALDDALTALSKLNARHSDVVELRVFGGLSVEETAEVLKVSPETVMRDWRAAKAWLGRELSAG
jgi:RNA polymerase sigma factor (TIGR02999 family)